MSVKTIEYDESDFEIIMILNRIISEKCYSKKDILIRIFQNKVWVERNGYEENFRERLLLDLAYSLENMVPSASWKCKNQLLQSKLFQLIQPAIENMQHTGCQREWK